MSVRKHTAPAKRQQLLIGTLTGDDSDVTSRLVSELAANAQAQQRSISGRSSVTFDLKVGVNVMNHGLDGKPRGVTVSPTVADATFAYAMTKADDKQATVTVLNVAQPGAGLEFWR